MPSPPPPHLTAQHPADSALAWLDIGYELVKRENLSPPAAARVYAYLSVAMYESVRIGVPGRRSLACQLTGLSTLPPPRHRGQVDWPAALAVAASRVLGAVLPFQASTSRAYLDQSLADALAARRAAGVSEAELAASTQHATAVATHLIAWIRLDGHAGIVDRPYTPPVGPAFWESTPPNFRPAVEPFWSEVRPMLLRSADEVVPAPHVPFDPDPASPFGQQAMAPYRQSLVNTDNQRATARFWTDNPGSFNPTPGDGNRPTVGTLDADHFDRVAAEGI